jgi:hypothetical protein
MRPGILIAVTTLLVVACGAAPTSAGHSPSASPSGSSSPAASPSGTPSVGSYGLLLSAGTLEMISPDGKIAASAKVAAPSVHTCGSRTGAVLQPPVSATADKVFFRDGNTKIRWLTPDGKTGDATTVPGSASKVSFFSVSPDDQRIAVLVEDLSPATTISLTLYVEDLIGHTNHAVIYTNSVPKLKNGTTLWPMGWHDGLLVLAVWAPCTFEPAGLGPTEWHVSNAATAVRVATIGKNQCVPSIWPSAAGVACLDVGNNQAVLYDWTGKITAVAPTQPDDVQSGLSPSGRSIFYATVAGIGAPPPATRIVNLGPGPTAAVSGHAACLWIDEDHLLAPDAVIGFASTAPGTGSVTATVTALPASGVCAGRFPGGL